MLNVAVVILMSLVPSLAWTAEPPAASSDRDLLIRLDQRQQQLDHEVQSLKGDLLRAGDQQQKALEAGQQAVRTQLESLDKRLEGKLGDLDKRWDTNFAQLDKRLDTPITLLGVLLAWVTGIVAAAFPALASVRPARHSAAAHDRAAGQP
jgi:hypothetical protein